MIRKETRINKQEPIENLSTAVIVWHASCSFSLKHNFKFM